MLIVCPCVRGPDAGRTGKYRNTAESTELVTPPTVALAYRIWLVETSVEVPTVHTELLAEVA
jgi:hypothetical protein